MRWESDAEAALERAGFKVVERDGTDDYQGWGALLATDSKGRWATLAWSYGTCSYCDSYEDLSDEELEAEFDQSIEIFETEDRARLSFADLKGW